MKTLACGLWRTLRSSVGHPELNLQKSRRAYPPKEVFQDGPPRKHPSPGPRPGFSHKIRKFAALRRCKEGEVEDVRNVKDKKAHGADKATLWRAPQAIRPVFPTQTTEGSARNGAGEDSWGAGLLQGNDQQKAQSCASNITFDMATYVSLGMNRPRCLYIRKIYRENN
jgi:hypothetical protein